jgi:4-oxalocrotonate tautomerase
MPYVTVHMWPGRSSEVKAKLIKDITEAVIQMEGVPVEAVEVAIIEVPQENWGIAGVPASQRRLWSPTSSQAGDGKP